MAAIIKNIQFKTQFSRQAFMYEIRQTNIEEFQERTKNILRLPQLSRKFQEERCFDNEWERGSASSEHEAIGLLT